MNINIVLIAIVLFNRLNPKQCNP